jgi:hypothetical protein
LLKTAARQEDAMALTGKFDLRKTFWGKIVLRVEEEVKPFWSKSGALKRRWRDAALMDLAAPEMRTLIDGRFRPHLRSQSSFAPEATTAHRGQHEAEGVGVQAPRPNEEVRRIAH